MLLKEVLETWCEEDAPSSATDEEDEIIEIYGIVDKGIDKMVWRRTSAR